MLFNKLAFTDFDAALIRKRLSRRTVRLATNSTLFCERGGLATDGRVVPRGAGTARPERAAFLSNACSGNPQLLGEVESLLAHEGKADGLLEGPALDQLAIGQVVSHYRITAKLGEGAWG